MWQSFHGDSMSNAESYYISITTLKSELREACQS